MIARSLFLLVLSLGLSVAGNSPVEVVETDVVVIGGGGAGTHAAIKLQLAGKKVALIEKQNRLGGHVNTYKDAATGKTFDYGVQLFYNNTATTSYFEHFDIPLVSAGSGEGARGSQELVNFATGAPFPQPENSQALLATAFQNYSQQLAKYPYLAETFDLPDPVPEDLTIPFGDFANKYGLFALVLPAHLYNQIGNITALPTLYAMKALSAAQIQAISTGGFVANGEQNNQLLYDRAQAELGSNAFLDATVTRIIRNDTGAEVSFETPQGCKVVKASKLIIAIPPRAADLGFLDLDASEKELLGTFSYFNYYDAVVQNTGLPQNETIVNIGGLETFLLPKTPTTFVVTPKDIPGLSAAYYGSYTPDTNEEVSAAIVKQINSVRQALNLTAPAEATKVLEIHNHGPYELVVSPDDIKGGFYKKLEALQGAKNTWWTGAAWKTHASSEIWDFNEKHIIPEVLK